MTTELNADPILSEPQTPTRNTETIPLSEWNQNQAESSSDTGLSTPIDPVDSQPQIPRSLEDSIPRLGLIKARTTGDYIQHLHDQSRQRFLIANAGPLAAR